MKKLFFAVLMCAVSVVAFASADTSKNEQSDVKYVFDKMSFAIDSIARDLKMSPELVRQTYEKQVEIEISKDAGAIWATSIVFVVLLFFGILFVILENTRKAGGIDFEPYAGTAWILACIMFCIAAIVIPIYAVDLYQLKHNPDYWIMEQIMSFLKSS